jgi:high affinity Mn2+ porin
VAGFPNGEAQKSNFPMPRVDPARIFVRRTFGFGGEQETIEDGPNQLAGKQDISLGILIGDGQLNYRQEKVFETHYAHSIDKWWTISFDFQFIANPGYNADCGPVSIFAGRLHAEF